MCGLDLAMSQGVAEKSKSLSSNNIVTIGQNDQLQNPDFVIQMSALSEAPLLSLYADALSGVSTGELNRFTRNFWEVALREESWEFIQTSISNPNDYDGLCNVIFWEKERGDLYAHAQSVKHLNHAAQNWLRGKPNWGKKGICISKMRELKASIYTGEIYDENCCAIIPHNEAHLSALYAYATSDTYNKNVRDINQSILVQTKYLIKVPFELDYWQQIAELKYPNGLPKPYSDDPTQWIFHGHPQPSTDPLQVAVARLLGYTWPAESDAKMELSDEARTWISHCESLKAHADDDGIVCLAAVRGEKPAHERLLALLIDAWETVEPGSWKPSILDQLLADADCAGKGLEVWLREKFFEQHAKRFQHRPFIWHIWDGLKDGFGALVNYHQLDNKNLERLIHTYLGDWIRTQEQGVKDGIDGAQARLAAARSLKTRLEAILEGEKPYDIFVRWKPFAQQAIGWNPDLNDGVRLNIRPFMTAEVLRHNKKPKLNITWDKDRGKDVESAPWFKVFQGDRINDHHLSLDEKRRARG